MKTFRIAAGLALAVGLTSAGSLTAEQGNMDGKKSEIEMEDVKKGPGQVVEIEGPGKKVKIS